MTNGQLKDFAILVVGWFGLALIAAKGVGVFTTSTLLRGLPYAVALLICCIYLLSLYRSSRQTHRPEDTD